MEWLGSRGNQVADFFGRLVVVDQSGDWLEMGSTNHLIGRPITGLVVATDLTDEANYMENPARRRACTAFV